MTVGIYCIRNKVNGKMYVGSSISIPDRFYNHRTQLKNGNHHSKHLQHAWNKYGADGFSFEILEMVDDITELVEKEQEWLDKTKTWKRINGYNMAKIASTTVKNIKKNPKRGMTPAQRKEKESRVMKGFGCVLGWIPEEFQKEVATEIARLRDSRREVIT